MPSLPPATNVIRAELLWAYGDDPSLLTRLFFTYTGGAPSAADCAALAADINSQAVTHLIPLLTANANLHSVVVQDLGSSTGADGSTTTQTAGTRSGSSLPQAVSVLSNYKIARRYRGGKPRSYWPFGTETDYNQSGSWLTGSVSAFLSGINAFFAGVIGSTSGATTIAAHVNVSYYSGFTNVPYGSPVKYRRTPNVRSTPTIEAVTSVAVSGAPASQRRRNIR
jgi:hypothetical protein